MSEPEDRKPGRIGCAVIVLLLLALLAAVGLWLGRRDDAARSPCERYARTVAWALDNCHSGHTRDLDHHTGVCERAIDATPACLEGIKALPCKELEGLPATAPTACRRAR